MAKTCNEGEEFFLLQALKKDTQLDNLYLGLFTAPTSEPAEDATLADLTEPSAGGYARIALAYGDWTVSGTAPTQAVQPQKTFNCSGSAWGNVYGWFICNVASGTAGKLLMVGLVDGGPYNVPDGGAVKVTPKVNAD
jgi:hypothetical protein